MAQTKTKRLKLRQFLTVAMVAFVMLSMVGCVYYNTFYNARKAFNGAEKKRKEALKKGQRNVSAGEYKIAIEKSLKVIENYPNSKWYDDALYVLGVSYFYTDQQFKAERRFRELLANYPESKYVKEANLYLAKTKLEQNDMEDAMALFETLLSDEYEKQIRAEAGMAIGEYHFENRDFREAERYFLFVRDSVGSNVEARQAQQYIADGYYDGFRFNDALGAYLQVLGLDPDKDLEYHALYRAALCSYRLQRINDGMAYLRQLTENELYFDSLPSLNLAIAYGYELDEDVGEAVNTYEKVALDEGNSRSAGEANFRLGLIYQFVYDDLKKAKEYYDMSVKLTRSSDVGRLALQHSSDIGKIDTYQRSLEVDSTTTQADIDEAAHTQYLLSELYYFRLNKPDSGMLEMQYLVDSFPSAYEVPKAMIALSRMYLDSKHDTLASDSILDQVLDSFPTSDYVQEVMEIRGLSGTAADTGYAYAYVRQAEGLVEEGSIDSARAMYRFVAENFPDSKYYLQAKFADIWLLENYANPGDSTAYFAYSEFIDSFPGTAWANEARNRTSYTPQRPMDDRFADTAEFVDQNGDAPPDDLQGGDTTTYVDPLQAIYIGPNGDSITLLYTGVEPTVFREEFEFPLEAYRVAWQEMDFYFQILLDFSGRVEDLRLMTPSNIPELDNRLMAYVQGMIFDITPMPLEDQGLWKVYKHRVTKPRELR